MAEVINNKYRTEFFSAPERHSNANISAEKKKLSNENDFRLRTFELECNFSSYKTAISYRNDFNWSKFPNEILNFVFIRPSSSSCVAANPENRRDKNWVRNKLKCENERVNEKKNNSRWTVKHEYALTSTRQRSTKKRQFSKESQTLVKITATGSSVLYVPELASNLRFTVFLKPWVCSKVRHDTKPSSARGRTWSGYF